MGGTTHSYMASSLNKKDNINRFYTVVLNYVWSFCISQIVLHIGLIQTPKDKYKGKNWKKKG